METMSPKTPALTPEQIRRAAYYMELVRQEQGGEEEKAALAEFHADGPELARLIGEFVTPPLTLPRYMRAPRSGGRIGPSHVESITVGVLLR
ncbi:hypothetical protein [Streptomyces sp. NPDC020141]|uniref:hypothetical protein n=1 Tax=Streptomyces sp. NPDC020141 TaxID=3365065 RepID=UPI003795C0B0